MRRAELSTALACTVFVCRAPLETPTGRYLGMVHIQRLLREPPHASIGGILDKDVEPLAPDATLGQLLAYSAYPKKGPATIRRGNVGAHRKAMGGLFVVGGLVVSGLLWLRFDGHNRFSWPGIVLVAGFAVFGRLQRQFADLV
mgnify:CR=1 FL=1